jgi:hypothetical protein
VIESGFGSLDTFNMLVSGLFDQRAVRVSVRRPSRLFDNVISSRRPSLDRGVADASPCASQHASVQCVHVTDSSPSNASSNVGGTLDVSVTV